jgi:hypothetical protein
MRESYSKDLASHAGPELYAGGGNVAGGQTAGTEHIKDNQNTFEFATKAL